MGKFNELPVIARVAIMAVIGGAIFAGAWYGPMPGFAAMKVANEAALDKLKAQELANAQLRPFEGQLKQLELQIDSLQRQMDRQKQIVPDTKKADEFIHEMQADAVAAGVEIRDYLAKPVNPKQYYTEVPFDMEIDGPYFNMLNFFQKVGTMERIVNVDNLRMSGIGSRASSPVKRHYDYAPGETVTVACTAKTFFSQTAQIEPVPVPGNPPGTAPANAPTKQ